MSLSLSFTNACIWKSCISKSMWFYFHHTLDHSWILDFRPSATSNNYFYCSVRTVACAKGGKIPSEFCIVGVRMCFTVLSHSDASSSEQRIVGGKQTRTMRLVEGEWQDLIWSTISFNGVATYTVAALKKSTKSKLQNSRRRYRNTLKQFMLN